ncbi:MAG: IS607 family element RNA-guided endonuclease TnpB, partial [Thermoleophilaceae bacterium]
MATVTQAYRFCLAPSPAQERKLASHAGAARFAYNWALGLVKDRLDRRGAGEDVEVPWTLPALRREWNRAKDEAAPWWPENSKEAACSGLDGLARALRAFSDSRKGRRRGRRVGFPRFKRRGRCRESFRYTTGSFGLSGRTRIQLPRIGHVRAHEPTSKLQRKIEAGDARVLSATVSRQGGRWFCSLTCEVSRDDPAPARPAATVGVDAGVRQLAVLSTGERVENPKALSKAQRKLRRLQRKADRQRRANNPDCYDERGRARPGKRPATRSSRQRRAERQITRLHGRVANVRRDALHKLTTRLASTYGTVVVEHLGAAGLCRAGNRGLRRALHDASLAELRRQLTYKCAWRGGTLIEAPTFYPSSKTCSGCRAAKAKLPLSERTFRCEQCGLSLDRDENAARNLAGLATVVAASGAETENARSPTQVRPGPAGHRVDREAGSAQAARKTGAVSEQSEAA